MCEHLDDGETVSGTRIERQREEKTRRSEGGVGGGGREGGCRWGGGRGHYITAAVADINTPPPHPP